MRVTGIREGTAEWRSFHFRPKDPVWAAASALDEARRRLASFDPRLSLWWSPSRHAWDYKRDCEAVRPGRWRVVEWMPNRGNWETCFYWEGENGEYRDPLPVEPILQRLGRANVTTAEAARVAEDASQGRERTKHKEMAEAFNELHEDLSARHSGVRQTFGPGYIRRRKVKQSDLENTNHQRFLRDHAKKWSGSSP